MADTITNEDEDEIIRIAEDAVEPEEPIPEPAPEPESEPEPVPEPVEIVDAPVVGKSIPDAAPQELINQDPNATDAPEDTFVKEYPDVPVSGDASKERKGYNFVKILRGVKVEEAAVPENLKGDYTIAMNERANGKKMSVGQLADVGTKLNDGKAQWMYMKNHKTGQREMVVKVGEDWYTDTQILSSIEKASQITEAISGKGPAVAQADAIADLINPSLGQEDPTYDIAVVMKSVSQALIANGLLTIEEAQKIADPESVDVAGAVPLSGFKKYIKAGLNARDSGESRTNVVTLTLSAIAADEAFERMSPKQKAQALITSHNAIMAGVGAVDDNNIRKAQSDIVTEQMKIGKAIAGSPSIPDYHFEPSEAQKTAAQKMRFDNTVKLNELDINIQEAGEKVKTAGGEVVPYLKSLGINTKAMEEVLAGRKVTNANQIMLDQIRSKGPEVQAEAMKEYSKYASAMGTVTGLQKNRSSYLSQIKEANSIMNNGIAYDSRKFIEDVKVATGGQINDISLAGDPAKAEEFRQAVLVSETNGYTKEQAVGARVISRAFEALKEGQTDGKKAFYDEQKLAYNEALLNGKLSAMPGGIEFEEGIKRVTKEMAYKKPFDDTLEKIKASATWEQMAEIPATINSLPPAQQAQAGEVYNAKRFQMLGEATVKGSAGVRAYKYANSPEEKDAGFNAVIDEIATVSPSFSTVLLENRRAMAIEQERALREKGVNAGGAELKGKGQDPNTKTNWQKVETDYQMRASLIASTMGAKIDSTEAIGDYFDRIAQPAITINPLSGTDKQPTGSSKYVRHNNDPIYQQVLAMEGMETLIYNYENEIAEYPSAKPGREKTTKVSLSTVPALVEARRGVVQEVRNLGFRITDLPSAGPEDFKAKGLMLGDVVEKTMDFVHQKDAFLQGKATDPGDWEEKRREIYAPIINQYILNRRSL